MTDVLKLLVDVNVTDLDRCAAAEDIERAVEQAVRELKDGNLRSVSVRVAG